MNLVDKTLLSCMSDILNNYIKTANGAITRETSENNVLDYFAQSSALRDRDVDSIFDLFKKSYDENPLLTLKVLFYSRDIRGGQGERDTFRKILTFLSHYDPETLKKNIHLIPKFGRWDDCYSLFGSDLHNDVIKLFKNQLLEDKYSDNPSLLAKWLKSENTSSKKSVILAKETMKSLEMSPKEYRKTLSKLRKKINLLETKMTNKNYKDIDYSKIPSQAGLKYRKAFIRNDEEKYAKFLEDLANNNTAINSETIYPYQLVEKALSNCEEIRPLLNSIWINLPNYIGDTKEDSIAVIDVSGSMGGTPLNMAISLGLYLAENNKGYFYNHFITFSEKPSLEKIKGIDFYERVRNISKANWGYSTNLEAVFNLILNTLIKYELPQSEMPTRIFVISDMEFNQIESYELDNTRQTETFHDTIKSRFRKYGYELPKLVYWNVNSFQNNIPATSKDNIQLISGSNPVIFESLLKGKSLSAYDLMLMELNKERYNCITI